MSTGLWVLKIITFPSGTHSATVSYSHHMVKLGECQSCGGLKLNTSFHSLQTSRKISLRYSPRVTTAASRTARPPV